jgi:hypothetical protein
MALLRYQLAFLVRSQRWLPPTLLYAVLVVAGSMSGEPLRDGLGWSGAALVPTAGWLTRSVLTAEPVAASACSAAAGGVRRAHLSALVAALLGGLCFAILGVGYELLTSHRPVGHGGIPPVAVAGLAAGGVCVLVGVAIGALCSPPLVRRPAQGMLGLAVAAIVALVASVSPANAAIHTTMSPPHAAVSQAHAAPGLPVAPAFAAAVITAAVLALSTLVAAYRNGV